MVSHDGDWILFRLQRLNPARFEELCVALLTAKGHLNVRHLGASGSERGVDILSEGPDGRRWVTQCKRYRSLSAKDIRSEIRTVIAHPVEPKPQVYHLAATCNVSRATDEALRDAARVAPFPLEIGSTWGANELVAMLRDEFENLREEFIGPSRQEHAVGGLYGVPSTRSVEFVGRRTELEQLTELLASEGGSVRLAASVEGLAGIGKTELALQLVHHLADRAAFLGGIFWLDAERPDLSAAWGGEIADELGLPEGSVAERAAAALRTVSQRQAPVLIVLDNVTTWTAAQQPGPLPKGSHLRYLVTTRQRKLGGSRFRHMSLGFLDPRFARELLTSVAQRDLSSEAGTNELLEHLGGHALASSWLAHSFVSTRKRRRRPISKHSLTVSKSRARSASSFATTGRFSRLSRPCGHASMRRRVQPGAWRRASSPTSSVWSLVRPSGSSVRVATLCAGFT